MTWGHAAWSGALLLLALDTAATAPAGPTLTERLRWNPRERVAAGLERLAERDAEGAAAAFDTAYRLAADDPRAAYDAGTGRLAAGRADAAEPLERALELGAAELTEDAWYNLGNARLAGGAAEGAIAAYIEVLRRAPGRADAKHNLELAQRLLDEQRRQQDAADPGASPQAQRSEQDGEAGAAPGGQPATEPAGTEAPGEDSPADPGRPDPAGGERPAAGASGAPAPLSGSGPAEGAAGAERGRPLPDFRPQPELDREQALALLRAVEGLEREQRRAQALEQARARRSGDEDW